MLDNDDAQIFWACVKSAAEERYDWYPKVVISDRANPTEATIRRVYQKLALNYEPSYFSPLESLILRARCRLIADFADQLCFAFHYAPKPMKASGDDLDHFYRMLHKGFSSEIELRLARAIQEADVRSLSTL